ncbi:MAG: YIP1 family protein [Acidobacteria bacterium]|nr:YIP1 family protein [Acidobacteriota bacterium]
MPETYDVGHQAPPSPAAEMSEAGSLVNIFFEPGRTFEDLRRKPRWILGMIIIALLVTAYAFGISYKVGEAGMRRFIAEQLEKNPSTQALDPEAKANAIDLQVKIQSYTRYTIPVFVVIAMFIGGLLYFLGTKAFGGSGTFMQSLSVWVYSSIPPSVLAMLGSFIVLAIKSADEIDLATSQRGLIQANPSMLIDGKAHPILATLIATVDVFMIWGWILAAIGLRITNRLSSGSAWGVVIIIAVIGVLFRLLGAIFTGNPG